MELRRSSPLADADHRGSRLPSELPQFWQRFHRAKFLPQCWRMDFHIPAFPWPFATEEP